MLPIITLFIGAVILVYGYWESQKVVDEIELLFNSHVDSVAALVKEGTREAATSTALMYQLTEEHLLTTAHLLSVLQNTNWAETDILKEEEWRVHLIAKTDGTFQGEWGPIPDETKVTFIKWMGQAEQGELVDDGPVGELGLLCLYHNIKDGMAVICRDEKLLSKLRKETGIGPMLKGVIKKDIRYVALQDAEGILAVAPSHELLSQWKDDPFLETFLKNKNNKKASRLIQVQGKTMFEGLIPFQMADDSTVILRVGIDASILMNIQENSNRRYTLMVILVIGIIILVNLLTWLLWRQQIKKEEIDRILAIREEQQRHWETIGKMAATVAHEVRNPLNTIAMASQRMKSEFSITNKEKKEFNEMIDIIQSESKRVGRVVTEFLDLGKPLNLQIKKIEAKAAVNHACLSSKMRAEKEDKILELDNYCTREVELDQERFLQMMINVIDNALDAIPKKGKIIVRAECLDDGLHIKVIDNGEGLTSEKEAEVMKPFVSFKSTGTGLGLPLVKRLAEAHRGTFELKSILGQGTTAYIFIPSFRGKYEEFNNV